MTLSNRNPRSVAHHRIGSVLGGALGLTLVLAASPAGARPEFPGLLAEHWTMPCVPSCAVCHFDASGGPAKIRQTTKGKPGFGAKLRSEGLDVTDVSSIRAALDIDKSSGSDVDEDGHTDFDELSVGDDPNDPTPGASVCNHGAPQFGCVRVARQGPIDGVAGVSAAAALALGLAALRVRLRRAR